MSPRFKVTDKILLEKMKKDAHKGKNNPNFTDIAMGLELNTGLRNTILDKIFHDIILGSHMHPKAN